MDKLKPYKSGFFMSIIIGLNKLHQHKVFFISTLAIYSHETYLKINRLSV